MLGAIKKGITTNKFFTPRSSSCRSGTANVGLAALACTALHKYMHEVHAYRDHAMCNITVQFQ
jgi:hypothetical protein